VGPEDQGSGWGTIPAAYRVYPDRGDWIATKVGAGLLVPGLVRGIASMPTLNAGVASINRTDSDMTSGSIGGAGRQGEARVLGDRLLVGELQPAYPRLPTHSMGEPARSRRA
jgi:hypothetical protein